MLLANFPQLQIPQGDGAKIDIDVHGWKFKITIDFRDSGTDQRIELKTSDDGVLMIFYNWNNSIGVSLIEPARMAMLSIGGTLEFLATNYRIGSTNVFSLQLLHNKEGK